MIKNLLKNIVGMCVCLMTGTMNWIFFVIGNKWWLVLLSLLATIFAFYAAYRVYKSASIIAKILDFTINNTEYKTDTLLKILLEKVERKDNETEEEIGHPV